MNRESRISLDQEAEETAVKFLIGIRPRTESICTKITPLIDKSPVFRAMLEGPLAENRDQLITVEDVDPRAFEILIRFMSGESGGLVKFKSIPTALAVIYAAKKYMVRDIDGPSLKYISKNINSDNVLLVLQNLLVLYNGQEELQDTSATPPSLNLATMQKGNLFRDDSQKEIENCLRKIIVNFCFDIIDKNGSKIFESDEFEDISLDLLKDIIQRDSLHLSSELCVWQALHRWSHRQCRRRHVSPTAANKRRVLEGAQYSLRFLTMTCQQFKAGQAATHFLTKEEEESILFYMLHKRAVLTKDLQAYQVSMSTQRQKNNGFLKHFRKTKLQNTEVKAVKSSLAEKISICIACILD